MDTFQKNCDVFLTYYNIENFKNYNKHLTFNYMGNYIENFLGQYFIDTQTNCDPIGFRR